MFRNIVKFSQNVQLKIATEVNYLIAFMRNSSGQTLLNNTDTGLSTPTHSTRPSSHFTHMYEHDGFCLSHLHCLNSSSPGLTSYLPRRKELCLCRSSLNNLGYLEQLNWHEITFFCCFAKIEGKIVCVADECAVPFLLAHILQLGWSLDPWPLNPSYTT